MENSIKRYLAANDTTQQALADQLNVSQATIWDWANGNKRPRWDKIDKLAKILKVNRLALLDELYSDQKK